MLVIDHISRFFGEKKALDDIAFDVAPGEVVGILGPNGAGKTTLLRTIAGILEPTSGDIRLNGESTFPPTPELRRAFGFLPEDAPLYPEMTAAEHLKFRSRLKGFGGGRRFTKRLSEMTEITGLSEFFHTPCAALSAGQRRRLALADALINSPRVLLLDAPLDNLDLFHAKCVQSALAARAKNTCVLVTGHNHHALAQVCARFITLHNGRVTSDLNATNVAPEELPARLAQTITEPLIPCA